MEDASTKDIFARMAEAVRVSTDAALARAIGVSPQSLSDARRKNKVPPAWAVTLAKTHQVSLDWLLLGRGPMRSGESPAVADSRTVELEGQVTELQKRLVELEQENKRLECEARNAQKEAVAAYKQAMDMVRDLVLQKGLPTIDAPASATTAPSISLTSDE